MRAFDFLAKGGKEGMLELKDMAMYPPGLAASWSAVGQHGVDSLIDLSAALLIVRKQTGSAEKANTGMEDLLAKVYSPDVQKNFKEAGVDLERVFKVAAKEGKPFFDALIEATNKVTKGDISQLPKFFGDKDSRMGTRTVEPQSAR
jgi:hypothetical protein